MVGTLDSWEPRQLRAADPHTHRYLLEQQIDQDLPPAITHSEEYYGCIGVALAWQRMFLLVARDSVRYR